MGAVMDWKTLLFSFRGRINRARYWLMTLIYAIAAMICAAVVAMLASSITGSATAIFAVLVVLVVLAFWPSLALAIKRLHDRNKSGWWLLLFWLAPSIINAVGQTISSAAGTVAALIGGIIGIWGFVEIACLKGTTGPNDYGADPLGAT